MRVVTLASLLISCSLQLIFSAALMAGDKPYFLATKEPPVTGHGPVGKVVSVVKDVPKGSIITSSALEQSDLDENRIPMDTVSDPSSAIGKASRYGLVKGQILNKQDLVDPVVKTGAKMASSTPSDLDGYIIDRTAAIKAHPKKAKAYLNRGGAYIKKGEFEKAIADFSTAIKLEPKSGSFYQIRSTAYLRKGALEKALEDATQAVRLMPDFWRYWYRAKVYQRMWQYQNAIEDCSQAIKLAPEQLYIYDSRAMLYLGLKNYDKALLDCDKAISMIPHDRYKYQHAKLYVHRAWLYRGIGNPSKALADCDKAIACEPFVSSLYRKAGDAESLAGVAQLTAIGSAYSTRGAIRLDQGRYQLALEDLNRALKLDSKCARCYALRALVYRKMGMEQKAIDDLSTAKKLDPKVDD